MNNNAIGDDGIAAISNIRNIETLWVEDCGITDIGAEALAQLLSVSKCIKDLQIKRNKKITVRGTCSILQSAVHNKHCKVNIKIDKKYTTDPTVKGMLDILKQRAEAMDLQVSFIMLHKGNCSLREYIQVPAVAATVGIMYGILGFFVGGPIGALALGGYGSLHTAASIALMKKYKKKKQSKKKY